MSQKMPDGRVVARTGLALAATLAGVAAAVTLTSHGAEAGPAGPAQTLADVESSCSPEALTALTSGLPGGVQVKPVKLGPKLPGGVKYVAASAKLPAYCQVSGSFVTNPKTGKTANFLATLPANWNGKYLQMGCSGHCGQFVVSDPTQPALTATYPGLPWEVLQKGYATFSTDEGHEGFAGGTWAVKGPGRVDQDAIDDFYYRADQVLAGVGKAFTKAFYSKVKDAPQTIAHSYFNGCSGGGRDGFVAASYFPEAFDGIIAGSAYNGAGTAFQFAGVPVASLRSEGAYVPPELLKTIAPIVMAKCDQLDGVKDGLIQNPAACNFRPNRDLPKCADDKPGAQCFTKAQIETVSAAISAVTNERGQVVQPGFSVSDLQAGTFITPKRPADLAAKDPFPNSDNGSLAGGYWPLADAFLKVFVHQNDREFFTRPIISFAEGGEGAVTNFHIVVPQSEADRVKSEARMGIGHFPENADNLIKQNRKFLIWHNLSDHVLTPYMSINYYKRLAAMHGGYANLQKNVRLFGVPGTPHCGIGGDGPNTFDALTAMENWVEKGIAPDALMATRYPTSGPFGQKDVNGPPGRTMPLCKYPEMARYSGKGDVNDGANWTCPADDKRMLAVGESGRQAGVLQ
jgi:feruloyl esterase